MKKEYLPSKQFIARLIILAIIIAIVFGVYEISQYFKNRALRKQNGGIQTKLVVGDLIQKDSNNNGIPDWEENLWGLDPTKDGPSNKEFIMAKRAELAKEAGYNPSADTGPLSENDTLSREFFATIMSLQQTGNLDDASIKTLSDAIGKNAQAKPIADIYNKNTLKTNTETKANAIAYYKSLRELLVKYQGTDIGTELGLIAVALKDRDQGALNMVGKVAVSYRAFGKDLMNMTVPSTLSDTQTDLANNYEKTAVSIEGMTKILTDPIIGMGALINYKKYNDAAATDIQKLSDNFTQKWYTTGN